MVVMIALEEFFRTMLNESEDGGCFVVTTVVVVFMERKGVTFIMFEIIFSKINILASRHLFERGALTKQMQNRPS